VGCRHLETLQGPEFGLNEYGQETTGKRTCLERLRTAGGDSFVFAVGWCGLWRCDSRAALRASAGTWAGAPPDSVQPGAIRISLLSYHGMYVSAETEGRVIADADAMGPGAVFQLFHNSDGTVSLMSHLSMYVYAAVDRTLRADGSSVSGPERFQLVNNSDGSISLRSYTGLYVSAQPTGTIYADRPVADLWEHFELVEHPAVPDSSTSNATSPENASVFSELCEYQEPSGGARGEEPRSPVFVKLWEWNFPDIARECQDYLGPNGFDAVQISPVTEHVLGNQWWTKYQPVSFGLNSRSGTAEELRAMVAACRAAGVQVIVDVIVNHVATPCQEAKDAGPEPVTPCSGWNGSWYGNRRIAGARGWDAATPELFHHDPGRLFSNCEVSAYTGWLCGSPDLRDCSCCACDMYGLPDWNSSIPTVRDILARHLEELHDIGVTMLRIDASIYTPVTDLSNVLNRAPWDYVYQEWWGEYPVADRTRFIGNYRDVDYRWRLTNALAVKDVSELPSVLDIRTGVFGLSAQTSLYPFAYHDGRTSWSDRGIATYKNGLEYHQQQKFFLAWNVGISVLVWGGYGWTNKEQGPPGCEQGDERCSAAPVFDEHGEPQCLPTPTRAPLTYHDSVRRGWVCEHRWTGVAGLVDFRKACRALPVTQTWVAGQPGVGTGNLAFRLGGLCFAAIVRSYNQRYPSSWGHLGNWSLHGLVTGLPPGRYCDLSSLATQRGWDRRHCPREVALGEGGVVSSGMVPEGDLLAIHAGARLLD